MFKKLQKLVYIFQSRNGTPYNKTGRWCMFVLLYLLPCFSILICFQAGVYFYYFYSSGFTDVGNRTSN